MSETNYSSSQTSGGDQSGYNAVSNPGGSIQDAMEATRNRLSSAYSSVQECSSEMLHGTEEFIQKRPIQSVIYAASIGAVIGLVAGLMLGGGEREGSWHRRWW